MRSRWLGTLLIFLAVGSAGLGLAWPVQPTAEPKRPKLVVVLVFDQLRGDYLKNGSRSSATEASNGLPPKGRGSPIAIIPMPSR